MPADRLLNTVLQHFQDVHDDVKTQQILSTTSHLLLQLSNPLNLAVLTSQLLNAPAIWFREEGLQTALRIISIFHSAASRIRDRELEREHGKSASLGSHLGCERWTRAIVQGLDDRSQRWQHLLVLTGILMGFEGNNERSLSPALRDTLEQAIATATNLALQLPDDLLAAHSIALSLTYSFPLLSEFHRAQINCNTLAPICLRAITGEFAFQDGQFMASVGRDSSLDAARVIHWPRQAPSYHALQSTQRQPLMANMGPLSKLAGFAVQHATDTDVALRAQGALLTFSRAVLDAWRRSPFCNVEAALEDTSFSAETLQQTWPLLWETLRKLLFASAVVLRAVASRSLLDPHILKGGRGPDIAANSLHILRNLFFISSRNGANTFEIYNFVYLSSIDVLAREPSGCDRFLRNLEPADTLANSATHSQRVLNLFYFNLAEHLSFTLPAESCEKLIVKPAMAHLSLGEPSSPFRLELFEAAHSAILATLCCPHNGPLTVRVAPFYIVKLFEAFPGIISPRQFRMAFKTVMEVVSPPFPIAAEEPYLSETLLEMLRSRVGGASTTWFSKASHSHTRRVLSAPEDGPLSVQSTLVMALIDSLPLLPLAMVEDWLTVTAQLVNDINDARLRRVVRNRLLDILVNGELDVERSVIAVAWWGTKGGKQLVSSGSVGEPAMMSGAIASHGEEFSRL